MCCACVEPVNLFSSNAHLQWSPSRLRASTFSVATGSSLVCSAARCLGQPRRMHLLSHAAQRAALGPKKVGDRVQLIDCTVHVYARKHHRLRVNTVVKHVTRRSHQLSNKTKLHMNDTSEPPIRTIEIAAHLMKSL